MICSVYVAQRVNSKSPQGCYFQLMVVVHTCALVHAVYP